MHKMVESSFQPEAGAWFSRMRMPGGAGEKETRVCSRRGSEEERLSQAGCAGRQARRFPALGQGGCGSTRQADDSGWGLAVSEEIELGLTRCQKRQWCL